MNDTDRRLEAALKSVSAALRDARTERAVGAHAEFRRRLRRLRVTRLTSVAAAAGVMGIAIAIAATQGTDLFDRTDREPSVNAPPAGTYIRVSDDPVGVSVDGRRVWIASSSGNVTLVNPATNESTGVVPVGGALSDIALSAGKAWFADSEAGSVRALDATATRFVDDPVSLGTQGRPIDLDAGPQGTIWATSYDSGMLISIDPASGEILARLPVTAPVELAIARGSIWALTDDGRTLVSRDFDTGAKLLRAPAEGGEKTDLAATSSSVFIALADGTILQVDPGSGNVTARATVGGANPEIAVGDGALWVASDKEGVDAELVRLDLVDLQPLEKPKTFAGAPTDIALGHASAWVTDTGRETVVRLKAPR